MVSSDTLVDKIAARLERPADAEQSAGVTDSLTKVRDGGWVGEVEEGLCYRDATHLKLKMLHYSWSRTFARQFAICSTIYYRLNFNTAE